MPIYVYKFIDTGETIEVQQAFTDDALTEYPHPSDGTPRSVKKVFQPVGVTFKGGGFYKTDSRGGSSGSGSSGTASTGTSSGTTPGTASSGSGESSGSSGSGESSGAGASSTPAARTTSSGS